MWTQFRGDSRDGRASGIPRTKLGLTKVWEFPLPSEGVGGIAANDELVVVTSRDANDLADLVYVLDPSDGGIIYRHQIAAPGRLDYGNSVRATPVIGSELIYVQTAFGNLVAIDPTEGAIRWQHDFDQSFAGQMPTWGYCASPLLVKDQLIVQPDGPAKAVVSLDALSGQMRWWTDSDHAAGYASPLLLQSSIHNGAESAVVICDQGGLAAVSLESGKQLWRATPENAGEFMVPSPIQVDDWLIWMGEANGIRAYRLSDAVSTVPTLKARNEKIFSDVHSPTSMAGMIVVIDRDLIALDPANGLNEVDRFSNKSLDSYATVIVEADRVLVCCTDGKILLLRWQDRKWVLIEQQQPHQNSAPVLAQPALANRTLYLRRHRSVVAYRLTE